MPLNGLLANRVVDGLDGAVARATVATVRGAFPTSCSILRSTQLSLMRTSGGWPGLSVSLQPNSGIPISGGCAHERCCYTEGTEGKT